MTRQQEYLPEIDRLRGIAVLMVIFHHLSEAPYGILSPWVPNFLSQTWTGVDLFFVISGFVIYRHLIHNGFAAEIKIEEPVRSVARFFWKRFWRIVPAALFWAVLPLVAVMAIGGLSAATSPENILRNFREIFTLTFNYALLYSKNGSMLLKPYWSLCVEEHFYLVLPWLLICFSHKKTRIALCVAVILLTPLLLRPLGWDILQPENKIFYFRSATHGRLDGLFLGVLLAELNIAVALQRAFSRKLMNALSILVLTLLALAQNIIQSEWTYNLALSSTALLSGILVALASLNRGYVLNFPVIRSALLAIGKRSFSLYLAHMPTYFFVIGILGANAKAVTSLERAAATVLYLALLASVTFLSHRWLELPLREYGRRWGDSA